MSMMMKKEGSLLRIKIAVTLTLLLCFLTIHPPNLCTARSDSEVRCIESERHALLNFKQHLTDPSNRLVSWAAASDVDCCDWVGVLCHNVTGHVIQLRLRSHYPVYDELTIYDEEKREAQYEAYERSVFGEYLSDHFVKSQRKTTSLCLFGQNKQALSIKFEGYFGRFLATTIMKLQQLSYKRASLPSLLCPVEELKEL